MRLTVLTATFAFLLWGTPAFAGDNDPSNGDGVDDDIDNCLMINNATQLGLAVGPTAGSLAATSPVFSLDISSGLPVFPGSPLANSLQPPLPGFCNRSTRGDCNEGVCALVAKEESR